MKDKIILAVCLSMLVLLPACRKSYTCRCDGGASGNGKTITIENKTRQQAEEECDAYNSNGPLSYHGCQLK